MAINPSSYLYIKQNFTSKKQIDDYIELLQKAHMYGIDIAAGRNIAYNIFIGGSFDAQIFLEEDNHWYSNNPPSADKIIQPEPNDELWIALRKQALGAVLSQKGGQNVGLDEKVGLQFLREKFDKSIPDNISIDDVATNNAWEKFYSTDKDGTSIAPSLGNGYTLFGSWYSLGVFKDYVINRLKSFDIASGNIEDRGQVESPENKNEVSYQDRLAALEDFLSNAGSWKSSHGYYSGTNAANLYQTYLAKHNRTDLSNPNDSVENSELFSIFQKILAPARGTNLLETSSKFQETLFSKIENSGLIDLLTYVDEIRQFGRDRLKNEESLKASAGLIVNRN